MIISNTRKYIFLAIPKTASHAIRFALRRYLDEEQDWEQVAKYVDKKLPIRELAILNHGHLMCSDVYPYLDRDIWNRYFKFAISRNPYDRFVSSCCFLFRNSADFNKDPRQGMKTIINSEREMSRVLLRPQNEFIADAEGNLMVDYVGRFENLQTSYQSICERIGIPCHDLSEINRNLHSSYTTYLDDELRQQVLDFYGMDFDLLEYPRECDSPA